VKRDDVKREDVRTRIGGSGVALLLAVLLVALLAAPAGAQPTQEEVFKSIGDNVNEPVDSGRVLGVIAGIAGVVVLVAVVGQWRARDGSPKALHHHGKLVKEVLRALPLKGAEVKQLKAIVQDVLPKAGGEAPESPITLLLCPSLLARAAQASPERVDRRLVAGLVKRLAGRG
jgi:hypothetical protein